MLLALPVSPGWQGLSVHVAEFLGLRCGEIERQWHDARSGEIPKWYDITVEVV